MSEEMINLESYDTLGIRMENATQNKIQDLPQPTFFMNPKNALPFWLVRSLQDKMPMLSIPEKIKQPYTRGLIGQNLIHSLDPNEFVIDGKMGEGTEYAPLHDKHLKRFFKSPTTRALVESTGEIVNGRTVCKLKEYNAYRKFIHSMQLNHVTQEQREEEVLKMQQMNVEKFMRGSKIEGKKRWNAKFNDYLKQKNQETLHEKEGEKLKKCLVRMRRVDQANERVRAMQAKTQEMRTNKWLTYKKRMATYFQATKDDQRRLAFKAKKRWMVEAVLNEHSKSLALAEVKLKRELIMEANWKRRKAGQELKLKKDDLVRQQYSGCIQLMRQRREKYYNRKDVAVDELLALPGMNSLEELEIFNTNFDEFSPELVTAMNGAKIFMNPSGRSTTLDKSLRKFITHHESATERMKKANVARPIKYALDLLVRRAVGYYSMVVAYKALMESAPLAVHLGEKIRSNRMLRELLLEEYEQFGPRSDTPFETLKKFGEAGLKHCICDYTLIDKETMEWPCPLCRRGIDQFVPAYDEPELLSAPETDETVEVEDEKTTLDVLLPPQVTSGHHQCIEEERVIGVAPLFTIAKKIPTQEPPPKPPAPELLSEPEVTATAPVPKKAHREKNLSKGSKKSKSSKKSVRSKKSKISKKSRKSRASSKRISKTGNTAKSKTSATKKPSRTSSRGTTSKATSKGKSSKISRTPNTRGGHVLARSSKLSLKKKKSAAKKDSVSKNGPRRESKKKTESRKSILKETASTADARREKGVSFAQTDMFQRAAQTEHHNVPKKESLTLVQRSISKVHLGGASEMVRSNERAAGPIESQSTVDDSVDVEEQRSSASIVSLISITSDDRLHFVKGQCVYSKRGSKMGKLKGGESSAGVKKGFVKGTCDCRMERAMTSDTSGDSNVTIKIVSPAARTSGKAKGRNLRWRGDIQPADPQVETQPRKSKQEAKQRFLQIQEPSNKVEAEPPHQPDFRDGKLQKPKHCKCRARTSKNNRAKKTDRLAYITKIIGGTREARATASSDKKSATSTSRKASVRSIVQQQKKIISKLQAADKISKPNLNIQSLTNREPEVQKCYMDDCGALYLLDRYGRKTALKVEHTTFRIDESGRKYFIDDEGKKYLIDVTGRVYLEDENGDVHSLFYEEGKEYLDPEPKKLMMHELVRESVVDLLDEPEESFFNEDDLVELVYDYMSDGKKRHTFADEKSAVSGREELATEDAEQDGESEIQNIPTSAAVSSKAVEFPKSSDAIVGPRMPIKRSLNSLITEVAFNHDISKLFIQRKKFQDCCSIALRRCLLYSFAKYTKITERGIDALDLLGNDKTKVTDLDGMVKGLAKITAHYPLNLIKSKRLAPYVEALVQGFLGTQGYNIFPQKTEKAVENSSDNSSASSTDVEYPSSRIPGQRNCLCGKPNAAGFTK